MTKINFRAAHSWLNGYSDAKAGRPAHAAEQASSTSYDSGYLVGVRAR